MSLRRRLLTLITLLMVASLLSGGLLTYWNGVRRVDVEMSSALSVGENSIRETIEPMLASGMNDALLRRAVASFNGDRHLKARLLSSGGVERVASTLRMPSERPPPWLVAALAKPTQRAEIALPGNAGTIQLIADPLNEISEVWDDAKLKLGIVGGFCLLVLGMISFSLGRALKPLEDLSSALQRVGGGDYQAHVSEAGPEELAVIYRGFNTMAAKLSDAELRNRQLNAQLTTVQDEERAEIARDLHDEVGPFLFAVDVDAQMIPALVKKNACDKAIERTQAIRQSVGHMQTQLRSILQRLQPGVLLDLGLADAAQHLADFWQARYPHIRFDVDCSDESFGNKIDEAIFRILQEGTSNAVRHGKPEHIKLSAHRLASGDIEAFVSDDGMGMPAEPRKGFGLAGMRDRIAPLGGTLTVAANGNGQGVMLKATFAVPAPAQSQPHSTLQSKMANGRAPSLTKTEEA